MLALALGALIGLALGMLGGGGSILTVPALVYLLGEDPHAAIGSSLVIVGVNALVGAWLHMKEGHVRLRAALTFGASGIIAAYLGGRLSQFLPAPLLLILFAVLMIVVAIFLLRGTQAQSTESGETHEKILQVQWQRVLAGGLAVGFLTGFLGVGGGFLIVPALVLLLGMRMRDAVGSSLVVIAINSGAGLLGHLSDTRLNWELIGLLLAGGLLGLLAGIRLAGMLPARQLRQAFALFVILLGVTLLAINLTAVIVTL